MVMDRLPPHDIEAEEAVIASCLVESTAILQAAPLVRPEDFFREMNGWVFDAMLHLQHTHVEINQITVCHELKQRDQFDKFGQTDAAVYLSGLVSDLPTTVGLEDYARIVRRTSGLRDLISYAGKVAQLAYNGDDFDAVATEAQAMLTKITSGTSQVTQRSMAQIIDEKAFDEYLAFMQNPAQVVVGVPTTIKSLDRMLRGGGLLRGATYVICAPTSVGKSSFIRWILSQMAIAGHGVILFSMEQDENIVAQETIGALADFDRGYYERTGRPVPQAEESRIMAAIGGDAYQPGYIIVDRPSLSSTQIRLEVAKRQAIDPSLAVVAIDYLHIMRAEKHQQSKSQAETLENIVRDIRDMARDFKVAVILASQLNREVNDSQKNPDFRPRLDHLRASGAIEFLVDSVWGLFQQDYYIARGKLPAPPGSMIVQNGQEIFVPTQDFEIGILKQRLGQAGVTASIKFDQKTRRFWEV